MSAKVQVIFTHDDEAGSWVIEVLGATSALEAKQAFTAVNLTCRLPMADMLMAIPPDMLFEELTEGHYKLN